MTCTICSRWGQSCVLENFTQSSGELEFSLAKTIIYKLVRDMHGGAVNQGRRNGLLSSRPRRQNKERNAIMKRYLLFAAAALLLGLIVAPNAFATRVIFDPIDSTGQNLAPNDPVCASNTPCNVGLVNTMYQATFLSCSSGDILPASVCSTSPVDSTWYGVWFNNVTGTALNTFSFSIPVPPGINPGSG